LNHFIPPPRADKNFLSPFLDGELLGPNFSPGREARAHRCPEIQGFVEISPRPELGTKAADRRERDKARRRTLQR